MCARELKDGGGPTAEADAAMDWRLAALVVFLTTLAGASVTLLLVKAGGVWNHGEDLAGGPLNGGCGSLISRADTVFYRNEFICSDYYLLRVGIVGGILIAGFVAYRVRNRIRSGVLLAFASLVLALSLVSIPVPMVYSDISSWGNVVHRELECDELAGPMSLLGHGIVTDTTLDERCNEHLRPMVATGRVLLVGGLIGLIASGLGQIGTRRGGGPPDPAVESPY